MATDNVAKQLSSSIGVASRRPLVGRADIPGVRGAGAESVCRFRRQRRIYPSWLHHDNCIFSWYPADDPYVTAVGGTDLTTSGPGGAWQSETAWVDSGGGFSTNGISIPSYQAPVINSLNQGSTTLRNIPDVAAEANATITTVPTANAPTIMWLAEPALPRRAGPGFWPWRISRPTARQSVS